MIKRILIGIAILAVLSILSMPLLRNYTKSHSPEELVKLSQDGVDLAVFYCRPSKKDRVIFGGLVPYGEVWRTGANEPTTFETNKPLTIGEKQLAPGKYSMWTIPEKDEWEVIFNSGKYDWGVGMKDFKVVASRDPQQDVLNIKVPVQQISNVEQFTIKLNKDSLFRMELAWDDVKVEVPMQY